MATVTNWIDHLNKPAEEVVGAVYPGAGSVEGILVIVGIILWVGWHVLTAKSEVKNLIDWLEKDIAPMIIKATLPTGNIK